MPEVCSGTGPHAGNALTCPGRAGQSVYSHGEPESRDPGCGQRREIAEYARLNVGSLAVRCARITAASARCVAFPQTLDTRRSSSMLIAAPPLSSVVRVAGCGVRPFFG